MNRIYEFHLPVFKQGDDLSQHVEKNPGNPSKALIGLAEQYEEASRLCRRLASVASEGAMVLHADTHTIEVEADEKALAGLVSDGVLSVPPGDDEAGGDN